MLNQLPEAPSSRVSMTGFAMTLISFRHFTAVRANLHVERGA